MGRYSRYCRKYHCVESLEDERIIDFLLDYGKRRRDKSALFITRDKTVPVISAMRDRLQEHYFFALPPQDTVEALMDKIRLPVTLERYRVRHPKTTRIHSLEEIPAVVREIGLPCVIKPALRSHVFKASVATNPGELSVAYSKASANGDRIIAQEWIPGTDSDIYFCFTYFGQDGRAKGVFVGRKIRQFPSGTGIASEVEPCYDLATREETLNVFGSVRYRGFGSTEFKRSAVDGGYYLIEFTVGRTDYDVGCAMANGVDLPFIGYCDMVGIPTVGDHPPPKKTARWVDFVRNVKAIRQESRKRGLGHLWALTEVARSLSPQCTYTLFAADDLKPSVMFLIEMGKHAAGYALRNIPGRRERPEGASP
jgi:predicted ATP-grasp superfamily ATP-dependent carboligase